MRIDFIYGPFSSGNKDFNFERLLEDPAGLTGSESSCFFLAREMARRGHNVSIYTKLAHFLPQPYEWYDVKIWRLGWVTRAREPADVFYTWNEPEILKYTPSNSLRMMNQQLNDFDYCIHTPNFDDYVDIYTSPSESHLNFVSKFTPHRNKWRVLPNGVDLSLFDPNCKKIPGTVIYASSPDRGLHLLMRCWPKIKHYVPHATLKIFYDCNEWFRMACTTEISKELDIQELINRAKYTYYALSKMNNGYGIIHYKSVSKQHLAREMSKSMVLAYPCDSIRFTEGFSVTTLEACVSGMVPIISEQDSLGQIYSNIAPMCKTPTIKNVDDFTDLVINGLTNEVFRKTIVERAHIFASQFTWTKIAEKLENIMLDGIAAKKQL